MKKSIRKKFLVVWGIVVIAILFFSSVLIINYANDSKKSNSKQEKNQKNPSPNPPLNEENPLENEDDDPSQDDTNQENQLISARKKLLKEIQTECERSPVIPFSETEEWTKKIQLASLGELAGIKRECFVFIKSQKTSNPPPPNSSPKKKFPVNKTTGNHKDDTGWVFEEALGENLLKPTGEEPEYSVSPALPISSAGTEFWDGVISANFLPNGSALIMEASGNLKNSGIKEIIHAANGSPTKFGWNETGMTFKSTSRAVQNAIILAERNNYNKIAIPFLGGNNWDAADDIYGTAQNIINSALNTNQKLAEIIFVVSARKRGNDVRWMEGYNDWKQRSPWEIFQKELAEYEKQHPEKVGKGKIVKGDITDFNYHQCPVIVNHLNMEGKLAGKISQTIVAKSGKTQKQMEADIKAQITKFNQLFS